MTRKMVKRNFEISKFRKAEYSNKERFDIVFGEKVHFLMLSMSSLQ